MKKARQANKDPRGRKPGFPIPTERLEDLFIALKMNGRQLAEALDVSPALIVHWKRTGSIEPKHLREICVWLDRVKVQGGEHEAAWKRATAFLESFKKVTLASGSAAISEHSALASQIGQTPPLVDLSEASDNMLILELQSRGWDVSKMLLDAVQPRGKAKR